MLKPFIFIILPVGELEEHKRQLQKERDLKFEEATKHLNSVKSEVLSMRCELEARQKNVEDVVAEVIDMTFYSMVPNCLYFLPEVAQQLPICIS